MRQTLKSFIWSAAALLALAGCQREMPAPEAGGESQEEVLTSFVFNVSTTASQTKQTGVDTQAEGKNFRGIVDAKLLTYATGDANDGKILSVDGNAAKLYDLSKLATNQISENANRRILDMSLPLKTNLILLYGRANKPSVAVSAVTDYTGDDRYGKLQKYELTAAAGSGNFELAKRMQDKTNFYTMEKLLSGILTMVMNTSLTGDDHGSLTAATYGFSLSGTSESLYDATPGYPEITWSDYMQVNSPVETGKAADGETPAIPAHELYPLESQLQYVYQQMTDIRSDEGELRAGSGEATLRIVKDLWTVIEGVSNATPVSEAEAVAKYFATKVNTRLQKYFNKNATGAVTFNDLSTVISNFNSDTAWPAKPVIEDGDSDDVKAAKQAQITKLNERKPTAAELTALQSAKSGYGDNYALSTFPFDFNMPRGVSYMGFDEEVKTFYYPQIFNTSAVNGTPEGAANGYDAESYYFPAELLYFGNSPVRVSDESHVEDNYPKTTELWRTESQWASDWFSEDGNHKIIKHVQSTTRSVAMEYSVNYGVAQLETAVGYSQRVLDDAFLLDNNHAVQNHLAGGNLDENTEPDKKITVNDDSFKLTGVIIGGQPQNVDWNFLPRPAAGESTVTKGFIYDKAIHSQNIPCGSGTTLNYTTVFDNYNAADNQDRVFVALEFQNNTGKDFFGNCNLIRAGGYFYLIGMLSPYELNADGTDNTAKPKEGIVWPRPVYEQKTDPVTGDPVPDEFTDKMLKQITHVVPPYNTDGTSKEITRVFVQDYVTKATFKFGPNSLKYAYLTVPDLRASSQTLGLSVDIKWSKGLVYDEVILGGE